MKRKTRWLVISLLSLVAAMAAGLALHRECGYGGGMPGWYRDCNCRGLEYVDYDRTAADGKRRTVCLGVVVARSCHRYIGGPELPCEQLPAR